MPTPFVYTLIPLQERSGGHQGWYAGVGGRTRWTFTLRVAALDPGGSVSVAVETSATGESDSWEVLYDFGPQTAPGETVVRHDDPGPPFTVQPWHKYLRGHVTAATGEYSVELLAAAPFVDPTDAADKALFSKEFREWADGYARTVEEAEREVRALLLSDNQAGAAHGVLDVNLAAEDTYHEIRRMIVEQAEHAFSRYRLLYMDGSPAAMVTYRETPPVKPGLAARIKKLRSTASTVWRGR